jgi:hypothetical protein
MARDRTSSSGARRRMPTAAAVRTGHDGGHQLGKHSASCRVFETFASRELFADCRLSRSRESQGTPSSTFGHQTITPVEGCVRRSISLPGLVTLICCMHEATESKRLPLVQNGTARFGKFPNTLTSGERSSSIEMQSRKTVPLNLSTLRFLLQWCRAARS